VRIRLSVLIVASLLAAALAFSAAIFVQELRNSRQTIHEQSVVALNVLGSQLLNTLATTYALGHEQDASMAVAVSAMYPGVSFVLLVDEQGRIVLSSRNAWIGDAAADHSHYAPGDAARLLRSVSSRTETVPRAEGMLRGYYPLIEDPEKGILRPVAMYEAKDSGRNAVRLFSEAAQDALEQRLALEAALRQAIARREFRLYYQPQVDEHGKRVGAEALIRWLPPEGGVVPPGRFIALAEETGLIGQIGRWVLDEACAQLRTWAASPRTSALHIAVNVSPRQFFQPGFVEEVRASLRESGADPRRLKLELTEGIVLGDVDAVGSRMAELRGIGVTFSLDDFGTGYSSLSYLKRLPFEQVKIDRTFVRDAVTDASDAAIIRVIVGLGKALGLTVIAEGVETAEQCQLVLGSGCGLFQGYYFGRPMPVESWDLAESAQV
jgi:EAL domain-containing protein (putative c-di-GMP-specific phosphodiesterase class I)